MAIFTAEYTEIAENLTVMTVFLRDFALSAVNPQLAVKVL